MTFEPEAMERVIATIRKHPLVMHSPNYSTPCSKTCEVCNMDINVYNLARSMITERDEKAETIARLESPAMHEDYMTDAGHCTPGCPACKLLGWQ